MTPKVCESASVVTTPAIEKLPEFAENVLPVELIPIWNVTAPTGTLIGEPTDAPTSTIVGM